MREAFNISSNSTTPYLHIFIEKYLNTSVSLTKYNVDIREEVYINVFHLMLKELEVQVAVKSFMIRLIGWDPLNGVRQVYFRTLFDQHFKKKSTTKTN